VVELGESARKLLAFIEAVLPKGLRQQGNP
jgi:hypothetical protein